MNMLQTMSTRLAVDSETLKDVLIKTVFPSSPTAEQFASFVAVANEYGLNPLTKEIYAFPSRGGIQNIVSIDGWMRIINSHAQFDGMEFDDIISDGKLEAITCRIYRKDRSKPITVTEYMSECRRSTDTWKQWPSRMLRHKAAIQCARYAFGFSGIMEQDEVERINDEIKDITPKQSAMSAISNNSDLVTQIKTAIAGAQTVQAIEAMLARVNQRAQAGDLDNAQVAEITSCANKRREVLEFTGDE